MNRKISSVYQDPLDIVWNDLATTCGMTVCRDDEVFASWDGQQVLRIGKPETLDPDDHLAQMVLHEICHALVAGESSWGKPDWGLEYDDPDHRVFEHAALRLQAALSDEFGLREFLASTTDFREYYDRLPGPPNCPLIASLTQDNESVDEPEMHDPASQLAVEAMHRLNTGSWAAPIREALRRTRQIANAVCDVATEESLWQKANRKF